MEVILKTGVYQIRNIATAKLYIGSATRNFRHRWHAHRLRLRRGDHHNRHLQSAWNKYGESAFAFEVLIVCEKQDCVFYEQKCIDAFDSFNSGYNLSPTAGSTLGIKKKPEGVAKSNAANRGRKHTPESKARMRESRLGKKLTPKHCESIARARRGKIVPNDVREKIAVALTGKFLSVGTRMVVESGHGKEPA